MSAPKDTKFQLQASERTGFFPIVEEKSVLCDSIW